MINRVHQKRMAPTGGEMESANCPTKVSTSASSFSTLKKIEFIHSENRYDVSFFSLSPPPPIAIKNYSKSFL